MLNVNERTKHVKSRDVTSQCFPLSFLYNSLFDCESMNIHNGENSILSEHVLSRVMTFIIMFCDSRAITCVCG